MSAEDLATQTGLSLLRDLGLVSVLGIERVDHNGHRLRQRFGRVAGGGAAPGAIQKRSRSACLSGNLPTEGSASRPDAIHSACEDYRASAGIDLEHDRASRAAGDRIACDTLVLWGQRGVVQALFDPLALWQAQSTAKVQGLALPAGRFIPEELPAETTAALHGLCAT